MKELATKISNYKEEEMTSLKDKEVTLYESQNVCHIWKEKFCYEKNDKKIEYALYH